MWRVATNQVLNHLHNTRDEGLHARFIENNDNDCKPSYMAIREVDHELLDVKINEDGETYTITYHDRIPTRARTVLDNVEWGWRQIGVLWGGVFTVKLKIHPTGRLLEFTDFAARLGDLKTALHNLIIAKRLSYDILVQLLDIKIDPCMPLYKVDWEDDDE